MRSSWRWQRSSRGNLTNGSQIDATEALSVYNKKQFHHIFPEAFLKRTLPDQERSLLLNFCMLAASENNLISDSNPREYLPNLIGHLGGEADAVFRSNLLPPPGGYDYSEADLNEFVDTRSKLAVELIADLCHGRR